jgi:hypothetical protein
VCRMLGFDNSFLLKYSITLSKAVPSCCWTPSMICRASYAREKVPIDAVVLCRCYPQRRR